MEAMAMLIFRAKVVLIHPLALALSKKAL